MPAYSMEVANEFIKKAHAQGNRLTQMQLQKLVYIAHGWNLAIFDVPLTYDKPQVWDYGPVYREMWFALSNYGSSPVADVIDTFQNVQFSANEEKIIDTVLKFYGKFEAFQLSALTHKKHTPWNKIYNEYPKNLEQRMKNTEITDKDIKNYFNNIIKENENNT